MRRVNGGAAGSSAPSTADRFHRPSTPSATPDVVSMKKNGTGSRTQPSARVSGGDSHRSDCEDQRVHFIRQFEALFRLATRSAKQRGCSRDCEDVAQQAMLEVWCQLAAGTRVKDLRAFVMSIAGRRALDSLRSRRRRSESRLGRDPVHMPRRPIGQPPQRSGEAAGDPPPGGRLPRFPGRRQRVIMTVILRGGTLMDAAAQAGVSYKESHRVLRGMVNRLSHK